MLQSKMVSSYDMIRLCSFLLILLKSDISAFLNQPLWSQLSSGYSDIASTNRRSFIAWSVTNGPARLIIDNSRQIQEVAVQRKNDKDNNNDPKVYSFQRSGGTTSTGLWESKLRNAIVTKQWAEASKHLITLNSTKLSSGRDIVYVITETCRRSQNLSAIIPLLSSIVKLEKGFDYTTENDIMPLLFDCSKTNKISAGYRIISWLYNRGVKFSAKTYSVLLKGYALQRNEQMVDRILLECVKYKIIPDIVLFNGAIDAYIRCGNPQKAIDLFDSVISGEDYQEINNDKNNYSNKDKQDIIRLSMTFTNYNLKPNIRTFNTVLKAMRGYKSFDKCMEVIRTMQKNKIQPDSVTVNTLVDCAVITGNLDIAEDLIKHPMATPGVEAYTAIISGYSTEGNVTEAFRMLNLMISKEILPNSYTLTALMKTCIKSGNWERARELLCIGSNYWNSTSSRATRYPPDSLHMRLTASAVPYLTNAELAVLHGSYVIGLCSMAVSSEDLDERELYLKEAQFELITMEEKKLKPDTATMNAFIQALCAMQPARVTDALLILRAMKIENIEPDDYTYSILFTSLGKEGYIEEALQLFRNTEKCMDTPALNALLRAFIGGPNPLQAIKIYQEMITTNSSIIETGKFVPSKYTFTILFLAISRSIAPQKFASNTDRNIGSTQNRKPSSKPLRYLIGSRGSSQKNVNVNSNITMSGTAGPGSGSAVNGAKGTSDAVKNNYVDTTMKDVNPSLEALSVLGEVVRSIGVKLNAKINGPNVQNSYEINGVYGNYVSNNYNDMAEKKESDRAAALKDEMKKSQPLFYDDDSGRFYEQEKEYEEYSSDFSGSNDKISSIKKPLAVKKTKSKQSYTTDDIFDKKDISNDKYGSPDNLDKLRENYAREQEARIKQSQFLDNSMKTRLDSVDDRRRVDNGDDDMERINGNGKSSGSGRIPLDLIDMEPDLLLQKLFLSMRFDYNIEADEIMISALNSLFTTTNNFNSNLQEYGLGNNNVNANSNSNINANVNSGVSSSTNSKINSNINNNNYDYNTYKANTPPAVSLGWVKRQVLSKKTAELIFADLVISGWHPSMFQPILYSCGYAQRQVSELLREEETNYAIKKIRASSASIRIFKKHDWNNVESGWSGFFQ